MMDGDMLAAFPRATRGGDTLFGHNCHRAAGEGLRLVRVAGRGFAPGECVRTDTLVLPQVRRTWTVLAGRCPGQWGYPHGVNEHGVSIGLSTIRTKRREPAIGLTGPDLVRLGLERGGSARQAVDAITDLASRQGQGMAEAGIDSAFLVADGREAFVIEMFGRYWAVQRAGVVRAVSAICHLRQDWDHLAHGLSELAIQSGWWPANGSKLDFAGAVGRGSEEDRDALRRWGRATLLLERDNGQLDRRLVRLILADHFEDGAEEAENSALCRHESNSPAWRTAASFLTQTRPDGMLPVVWYSFGPPCRSVYFPLFLTGELPMEYQRASSRITELPNPEETDPVEQRAALAALQERFDEEADEFATDAAELRRRGEEEKLARLAEIFMQHNWECWENLCREFAPVAIRHD